MSKEIPSPWVTIAVQRGEKNKHLYWQNDGPTPAFHATEDAAQKWAEEHCRYDQKAEVVIVRVERLVRAKPVDFENIKSASRS